MSIKLLLRMHQLFFISACFAAFFFGCTLSYAEKKAEERGQISIIKQLSLSQLTNIGVME